ncbi:MAG TPA: rhodanese-like domain-containing protein [Mycobacteriales bacterium]|nr:rhodanese-like domain-containing protein [Mycobacteriales bacterium]
MTGSAERIEVAVAREMWAAGDLVVDVRLPEEYALGHIPGAINVPVDRLPGHELPPGSILTVCSMGNRSWRAAQLLATAGREALSIQGGTKAWAAAGFPVETAEGPRPRRRFWRPRSRRPSPR